MGLYWKVCAAVLLAVVLLTMRRQEMGIVLGMAVCAMAALSALQYLEPVLEVLDSIKAFGDLDGELLVILLKSVGIGLLTEIAGMICTDSGNGALAKSLQLLGTAVILWLSIPLFTALLELIRDILEGLCEGLPSS